MTPAEVQAQHETLELLNNEVAARLARQSDSLAKVDTKAVFLIGFAATAAQFLAAHKHQDVLAYFAFAAYALALLTGVVTMRVADYDDLEPRPMIVGHVRSHRAQLLISLAADRASIYEKNKLRLERKARYWTVSLWALVVGLSLSTVALLLHN